MAKVSSSEWRWVMLISLLIVAVFSLPYFAGLLYSTPQMRFGGFLFGLEDMYSYIAKMRWGARDGWLLQLVYTSEPHPGGFAYAHYLALGKLAALVSGQGAAVTADTLIITYHIARVVCGLLLLAVMYRFLAEFLTEIAQRWVAWGIAALAGGLGWIPALLLAGGGNPQARLPVEFYVPEGFSTLLLFGLPHLALARSLLLTGWLVFLRACEQKEEEGRGNASPLRGWRGAMAAGAAWLGMGIIVPFYAALLGVLLGVWLITVGIVRRRAPWRELMLAALAGALPAAFLIYNAWLFSSNPVFATWAAQNYLPSPPPVDYLLAYGVLLALAIPGAIRLWRDGLNQQTALVIIWPLTAAVLAYLPINVQRRLLEGVIVPLAALATLGIWTVNPPTLSPSQPHSPPPPRPLNVAAKIAAKLSEVGQWRVWLFVVGLAVLLLPSTGLLISGGLLTATTPAWPVFHPADELAALGWLHDEAPPESVVLCRHVSGRILPAYAAVRVYVGHGPETVKAVEKEQRVVAFFSDGMTDDKRRQLLTEGRIDMIWVGPLERRLICESPACFDPGRLGLREIFRQGEYVIYQVESGK